MVYAAWIFSADCSWKREGQSRLFWYWVLTLPSSSFQFIFTQESAISTTFSVMCSRKLDWIPTVSCHYEMEGKIIYGETIIVKQKAAGLIKKGSPLISQMDLAQELAQMKAKW